MKELYETLLEAKAELNKVEVSPSQKVIDKILSYSKNNAPMEHWL